MQLMHPAFTMSGKKKTKQKFASAEQKREHERLQQDWERLKTQYAKPVSSKAAPMRKYHLSIPAGRGTDHIKSVSTGIGTAAKAPIPVYTGTKIKGIGTMHKSNAVPVFSDEEAQDISKMRRG